MEGLTYSEQVLEGVDIHQLLPMTLRKHTGSVARSPDLLCRASGRAPGAQTSANLRAPHSFHCCSHILEQTCIWFLTQRQDLLFLHYLMMQHAHVINFRSCVFKKWIHTRLLCQQCHSENFEQASISSRCRLRTMRTMLRHVFLPGKGEEILPEAKALQNH